MTMTSRVQATDARRAVHGVLLLDKPSGLSSNRALQKVKRLYGAAKAGHTGSLDPLATGMLPICFGEATKLTQYMLAADKRYRVSARLGEATATGDAEGDIVARAQVPACKAGDIEPVAFAAANGPVETGAAKLFLARAAFAKSEAKRS